MSYTPTMLTTTTKLSPILARVVSGAHGTRTPIREPLLRIIKVQGISMTAGPRDDPDDETEPAEGETLYAYRIFLTDDVYIVGAVVDPALHSLVHERVLMSGAVVRLVDYDVKTSVKKFAAGKFTRYLKVRDLIVEHSPSIHFTDDKPTTNGTAAPRNGDEEGGEYGDEMVVIKQEAPPSQHASSSSRFQADTRVDGPRDRDRDPDDHAYGLDDDYDDDEDNLDSDAATPDSYATAADGRERPSSPDYTFDELDELTEEELARWPAGRVEPKTVITEETIAATWRNSQKERMAEQKENVKVASASSSTPSSSIATSGNPLKRPASQRDERLPSNSPKTAKSTPLSSPPSLTPPTDTLTKLGDLHRKPPGAKVNVLAIIAARDEHTIKRSIGIKRDLHLLDATTPRTIWLSVWVDAETFKPAVGACVLFRGLTVHRFDGRSLNAFKEVAGREWCVVEPRASTVAGVSELKEWWRQRAVEETLKSFGDEDL
ncbi:hypothetical protein Dda_1414 [Drechslerella dactyloides]|uniref:Uncharacterized protein n=1 Tax=Drechslerella dactyloides TaxID=74499 RepID=A0AAD6J660_DREDA|nr:hypothetical protein Dda_1414 [Drechslerella dactyloides]